MKVYPVYNEALVIYINKIIAILAKQKEQDERMAALERKTVDIDGLILARIIVLEQKTALFKTYAEMTPKQVNAYDTDKYVPLKTLFDFYNGEPSVQFPTAELQLADMEKLYHEIIWEGSPPHGLTYDMAEAITNYRALKLRIQTTVDNSFDWRKTPRAPDKDHRQTPPWAPIINYVFKLIYPMYLMTYGYAYNSSVEPFPVLPRDEPSPFQGGMAGMFFKSDGSRSISYKIVKVL